MTHRAMLSVLPAGLQLAKAQSVSKKVKSIPLPPGSEFVRLLDPATETPIVRLTSLASNSFLPAASNRFISTKDRFLIFSSDRTGRNSPFHMNLRSGVISQLGTNENVRPQSLCLDTGSHTLNLLDGSTLKELGLSGKRTRVLAEDVNAFSIGSSPTELVVVKQGKLLSLESQTPVVLAEGVADWCAISPAGNTCIFSRQSSGSEEQEIWYTPLNGANVKAIRLAGGRISNPCWSPDGRSVLFLREFTANGILRSQIHEVFPETCAEQLVTPTSQFAAFTPNSDGSVFVGASRSKAQPTIVLLLRASRRELTLCEHGAKNAANVVPVFSPDSRRVYFQSDREGKSAIYSVNVEALVEST